MSEYQVVRTPANFYNTWFDKIDLNKSFERYYKSWNNICMSSMPTYKITLPICEICGKEKSGYLSVDYNWIYMCTSCDANESTDVEPPTKIDCDCDLQTVLMVTGCKNPNHK